MQPSDEEVLELVSRFGSAPENHRSGEPVLDVVFADPGTNGFYYRERKSDSVAAFIRVDHIAALALSRGDALAKAEAENARLRFENTVNSEKMHSLQSEVTRLKAGLRMWHLAFKSGRNEQLQIVHEATTEFAALGGDDA